MGQRKSMWSIDEGASALERGHLPSAARTSAMHSLQCDRRNIAPERREPDPKTTRD